MERTETRWGYFDVINEGKVDDNETKLKKLFIVPDKNISYQKHDKRNEVWAVLQGSGQFVWETSLVDISKGMTLVVPVGSLHAVKAGKDGLTILELQYGEACEEDDIERIYYDWDNILGVVDNV